MDGQTPHTDEIRRNFAESGVEILHEPRAMFEHLKLHNLIDEAGDPGVADEETRQRLCLFDILLDLGMTTVVANYVMERLSEPAEPAGDSTAEVEPRFLLANPRPVLDWTIRSFDALTVLRDSKYTTLTSVSVPLAWSPELKDSTLQELSDIFYRLQGLGQVFTALRSRPTSGQGAAAMDAKRRDLMLAEQQLEMVLWGIQYDILPERPELRNFSALQDVYRGRRVERAGHYNSTNNLVVENMTGTSVCEPLEVAGQLMIDMLVASLVAMGENRMTSYPPCNIWQMIEVFGSGNPDSDVRVKRCIFYYLLLDMTEVPAHALHAEAVDQFAQTFLLPLPFRKLLYAFWLLDSNRQCEMAIGYLIEAGQLCVECDCVGKVLRLLYDYGHYSTALTFGRSVRPVFTRKDEVVIFMRLLLMNELLVEAFLFQRMFTRTPAADQSDQETLLYHFFFWCLNHKRKEVAVSQLIGLPFDDSEDLALIKFLRSSSNPFARDCLFAYYLQHCRYAEAAALHATLPADSNHTMRQSIIDSVQQLLPSVQFNAYTFLTKHTSSSPTAVTASPPPAFSSPAPMQITSPLFSGPRRVEPLTSLDSSVLHDVCSPTFVLPAASSKRQSMLLSSDLESPVVTSQKLGSFGTTPGPGRVKPQTQLPPNQLSQEQPHRTQRHMDIVPELQPRRVSFSAALLQATPSGLQGRSLRDLFAPESGAGANSTGSSPAVDRRVSVGGGRRASDLFLQASNVNERGVCGSTIGQQSSSTISIGNGGRRESAGLMPPIILSPQHASNHVMLTYVKPSPAMSASIASDAARRRTPRPKPTRTSSSSTTTVTAAQPMALDTTPRHTMQLRTRKK